MTIHDLAEYEILDEHRVEDVQSDGFILRHKKSGARIAILSNNDDNKVFYIASGLRRRMRRVYRILLSIPHYAVQRSSR